MQLTRILRSLRREGVVWSANRALSVLQERLFDFRYGTDTVTFTELGSLTILGQHAAEGTAYQPTRLRVVRRVLSALSPPPGSAFVDFGCGKGRVLLLAADYGFHRITGVEFAQELCGIARKRGSLSKENRPASRDSHCRGRCGRIPDSGRRKRLLSIQPVWRIPGRKSHSEHSAIRGRGEATSFRNLQQSAVAQGGRTTRILHPPEFRFRAVRHLRQPTNDEVSGLQPGRRGGTPHCGK